MAYGCDIGERDMQGRPLHVKHDARCVMVKVGGEAKKGKEGGKVTKFKKFRMFN